MKFDEMVESRYLKQSDVENDTLATVASLKKVNVARDDEDPEYRWTCKFEEFAKPMVLNKTNLKRMFAALGDDTDEWIGKRIVVYVDPDIEFGGNIVGGLRVRAKKQPAKTPARTEDDDGSIPF